MRDRKHAGRVSRYIGLLLVFLVAASPVGVAPRANAAFPGRNGRIAISVLRPPFTSLPGGELIVAADRDLFTISPVNGSVQQLTSGTDMDALPAWSPDGRRVAFLRADLSYGSISADVYVIDADGSGLTNLTQSPEYYDYQPSWSPDGTRIVFSSDRPDPVAAIVGRTRLFALSEQNLFIMDADGGNLTQVTSDPGHESSPAWSPDGRWIAFERLDSDGSGLWVTLVRPDGSGMHLLQNRVAGSDPQWSPDGTTIAFAEQSGRDVWVANANGSGLRNLTGASGSRNQSPTWSPDGEWIAFMSDRDGTWKLYKMRTDGSSVQKLIDIDLQSPAGSSDWGPRP